MREINLNEEREYENKKALGSNIRSPQSKYYWATRLPMEAHTAMVVGTITNKDIMEIGCASGDSAKKYTKYATSYVGFDLSNQAIQNCILLKLPNAKFICGDAHQIGMPDNSFDCIIVSGLLHHLDLTRALPEIKRLLKTNGTLLFREPLGINPLINLYRYLTQYARTSDERPFTYADLQLMKSYFHLENVQWFGFFSILSAFIKSTLLMKIMTRIDYIFSSLPIKYFYWQFSGVARKK